MTLRQDRMEQKIKELERKIKGLKVVKDFQKSTDVWIAEKIPSVAYERVK